jgi:hypothetical protein
LVTHFAAIKVFRARSASSVCQRVVGMLVFDQFDHDFGWASRALRWFENTRIRHLWLERYLPQTRSVDYYYTSDIKLWKVLHRAGKMG